MPTSEGAGSGSITPPSSEFKEYLLKRDKEQPFSFAGVLLAKAVHRASLAMSDHIEATVYRTRGGKFITSLVRTPLLAGLMESPFQTEQEIAKTTSGYNKAAVHDTLTDAMAWFRPGRLTDDLRTQLGLDKPIRID